MLVLCIRRKCTIALGKRVCIEESKFLTKHLIHFNFNLFVIRLFFYFMTVLNFILSWNMNSTISPKYFSILGFIFSKIRLYFHVVSQFSSQKLLINFMHLYYCIIDDVSFFEYNIFFNSEGKNIALDYSRSLSVQKVIGFKHITFKNCFYKTVSLSDMNQQNFHILLIFDHS